MKTKWRPLFFTVAAVCVIAAFTTCKKEVVTSQQQPFTPHQLEGCQVDVGLVCNYTIPHYASVQAFEDAYDCLEIDYEAHNNAYEATYSALTDDQYDVQVEEDLFNEEAPLDDWEMTYGYTSLRTTLTSLEDAWLAGGMTGPDPFDHAVADFIFMTLLNSDGDVKIGSDLYHFDEDGSVITVIGGDCGVFGDAKANPEYTHESVQRLLNVSEEICQRVEHEDGTSFFIDADRKFKWRVDFDSYVVNSRAKTSVRNFRKKNANWKRAPAKSYVYIGGVAWNSECLQSNPFSYNEKEKRRKRLITRRVIPSFAKIKTGEIQGLIEQVNDGAYIDTVIVWP